MSVYIKAYVLISTVFAAKPCTFFFLTSVLLLKSMPLKAKTLHNSVKVPEPEHAVCSQ